MRSRLATLILIAAGTSLGGCAYGGLGGLSVGTGYGNPYGYAGYGSPYGRYSSPYGYGGYGSPYGYGGYGGYGYDPYGYNPYYGGYSPYYGWHDGFYYPGTGHYVYDRERRPRPLTESLRRFWERRAAEAAAAARAGQTGSTSTSTQTATRLEPNWSGFNRGREVRESRTDRGLATRVRGIARERSQTRPSETRSTTRTVRSTPSRSSGLGSTLRRRLETSDD